MDVNYSVFLAYYGWTGASLVAQTLKNLSAMQEAQVWSLGWEDPLEKGKATHSSIVAWRIPWTEKPGIAKSQTWLSDILSMDEVSPLS